MSPPRMSPYRRKRHEAMLKSSPAVTYARNIYPDDIGLPADFACVIWSVPCGRRLRSGCTNLS